MKRIVLRSPPPAPTHHLFESVPKHLQQSEPKSRLEHPRLPSVCSDSGRKAAKTYENVKNSDIPVPSGQDIKHVHLLGLSPKKRLFTEEELDTRCQTLAEKEKPLVLLQFQERSRNREQLHYAPPHKDRLRNKFLVHAPMD